MVKTIYTEFSNEMISTAYQQIITKYDDPTILTDQQVAQDVIKVLQGEKVTKRRIKKKKKQTSTDIMDYLNLWERGKILLSFIIIPIYNSIAIIELKVMVSHL